MQTVLAILQVALGLGFVIFVHELGHFLVAKACGVRCDKFMIGFDIGGLKLSKKWGETEYGIGVLPLGGYVKMFGQEDNVAAIAEEMEKAKSMEGSPDAKAVTGPDGKTVWIDRRSYLAKSVPQRMAIISAGVIMNVIFAFLMAWVAFGIGVPEEPAMVGATMPGSPAWKAGLKTGDRLVRINDIEDPTYKQLRESVILGDLNAGLLCEVQRADGSSESITLRPEIIGPAPQVGVLGMSRLRLVGKKAVQPNTPAAALGDEGFQPGDQIVAVDGEAVTTFDQFAAKLVTQREQPIELTVIRGGEAPVGKPFGEVEGGERVTLTVAPDPLESLGIVPEIGPVMAIETGSPAEAAGLKIGDRITALDGAAIGSAPEGELAIDPMTLDERLEAIAARGESVSLSVVRDGETLELPITPRVVTWLTRPVSDTAPIAIDSLGAACDVLSEVAAIVGGSPAAEVDLRPGDRIVAAKLSWTTEDGKQREDSLELGADTVSWPVLVEILQNQSPSFAIELTVERPQVGAPSSPDLKVPTHTVNLKPRSVEDAFSDGVRGLVLAPMKTLHTAKSFGEQTQLAFEETGSALTSVLRFLQKIGGQVSVKALGGPITIAKVAGDAAFEGVGALLMSLVMLSANLAVLNFLPIPVLDGGHMVFLLYEGITGRPPKESVMIALQTVGLFLLLGLMLFVFTLDISRLLGVQL